MIYQIAGRLARKLQTDPKKLLEYVLNQPNLWEDSRLDVKGAEDEEEAIEEGLEAKIASRDVALFSLIETLDTDVSEVPTMLDELLKNSLWKRTLARQKEPIR